MYQSYLVLITIIFQIVIQNCYSMSTTNSEMKNTSDLSKGKRGVAGVVDPVQGHAVAGAHNIVPIAVPIPVPKPYPVGIPKPVTVPVGVPFAVRVAVPKPYPVPILLDPATAGLDHGLGLYGHSSATLEYNALLNHLIRAHAHAQAQAQVQAHGNLHAHNHFGHLSGHDQHTLAHYALATKFIH